MCRYLCDFIYYTSMAVCRSSCAFIHVPPLNRPYPARQLAESVRVAILSMLEDWQSWRHLCLAPQLLPHVTVLRAGESASLILFATAVKLSLWFEVQFPLILVSIRGSSNMKCGKFCSLTFSDIQLLVIGVQCLYCWSHCQLANTIHTQSVFICHVIVAVSYSVHSVYDTQCWNE